MSILTFSTKEVLVLLELKKSNLSMQQKLRGFGPSIKKGSKRGSARNVWSLADFYRAAAYNEIFDNGYSRELAARYTRSINEHDLRLLIGIAMFLGQRHLKLEGIAHMISTNNLKNMIEKARGNQKSIDKAREYLIEQMIKNIGPNIGFYLFFARLKEGDQDSVKCMPVMEDDPRVDDDNKDLFYLPSFSDVLPEIRSASDVYILNFSQLMNKIDGKILQYFPDKAMELYKNYRSKIDATFKKSDGKIKGRDLFTKLMD
jgi:hypothetical protein